jgi:hypothetical protein
MSRAREAKEARGVPFVLAAAHLSQRTLTAAGLFGFLPGTVVAKAALA